MIATNKKIAKIIEEIGEMLEIIGKEKDQFRIIAYQNAARKIEMSSREINDIYNDEGFKGLLQIKGIGESIAEKIEEIIKTGKCKFHDELSHKVPAPVLKFLLIPGVGPHIAKEIYDNYKAKSIDELKNTIKKDTSEKFFKAKTKQNILDGIEILSNQSGRMMLSFAEPIANEIIVALKTISEVKQADPVGSLRRIKETIGDIDIIASIKESSKDKGESSKRKVIDRFIHFPFVERVIEKGDTKTTIIHKKGPSVDLEILPEDEYGSLLQHFTGSKEHNIALRTWAEKHGFSISEYGIKFIKSQPKAGQPLAEKVHQVIKCGNERKVYSTLGMDWIPPELRENRGEIDASLRHHLPKLVELKDIKCDLHIHSTWSDGELSISEIAEIAAKMNYDYIAITDHTASLGITHGLKENDIDKYIKEIDNINLKFKTCLAGRRVKNLKFTILSGVEVNILADGSLDISDRELSKLDLVIASIHSGFRQDREKITNRLLKAIQNPNVDIIGHPSGRLLTGRQPLNIDWKKTFSAAASCNVAMEINSHPQRLDLNDELAMMAKNMGVKLVISTDAHQVEHFKNMRFGVAVARRGWLAKNDVLNTLTLDKLKKRIKK